MRRTMLVAFALVVGACGGSSSETTTFTTDIIDPGPESGAATFFSHRSRQWSNPEGATRRRGRDPALHRWCGLGTPRRT